MKRRVSPARLFFYQRKSNKIKKSIDIMKQRWYIDIVTSKQYFKTEDTDMAKSIVKEFIVRGRHFTIVKQDDFYCAIEDKYIDADGRLNTKLNGLQMHASKDLNMCLNTTKDCVEVDYLVKQGMSRDEALTMYWKKLGFIA
jgi:hypothetical protein